MASWRAADLSEEEARVSWRSVMKATKSDHDCVIAPGAKSWTAQYGAKIKQQSSPNAASKSQMVACLWKLWTTKITIRSTLTGKCTNVCQRSSRRGACAVRLTDPNTSVCTMTIPEHAPKPRHSTFRLTTKFSWLLISHIRQIRPSSVRLVFLSTSETWGFTSTETIKAF